MPDGARVPKTPLVGRDSELVRLRAMLAETAAGAAGCTVLTGPPGIGKTRLIHEVVSMATELEMATAFGRATEIDRLAPSSTLLSALRHGQSLSLDLSGFDELRGDRFGYLDRLVALLETAAARRPILIAVDDAQWADEFSVLAFRVLIAELSSSPVRWLLGRRGVRAGTDAQRWIDRQLDGGAAEIVLGRLDEESIGRLCRYTLGAEPDVTVLGLAAGGQGNPFVVELLLRTLWETDQILVHQGHATVVGGDLPASFHTAVEQRLRGLPDEARPLLRAAAVYGRPFSVHAAARLLGRPATELFAAADLAVATGVLVEHDTRLAFGHDLLRQAIYRNIPAPVRAAMHREAAAVLRDEGRPMVEIADQLVHAGPPGDREAVAALRGAAEQVAGHAPATAAEFIVHALSLVDEHDPERAAISAQAVGLLASAGRLGDARELGETALRGGLDPATAARLLLGLAEALKHAGQNRVAVEYARRALDGPTVPDAIRADLYAIMAHGLLYIDELAAADEAGATADRLGIRTGEHSASVFGNAARSVVARAGGRLGDALAHAGNAVQMADRERGEALHRHPRIWLGAALAAHDRFPEADAAYAAGRLEADRLGTAWSQPLWHFYNATLLTAKGRLADAEAEAEAGLRIAEQLTAFQLCVPLHGLLAKIAVTRAELPTARDHVRQMDALRSRGITAAPEDVDWPEAMLHQADGQPQLALRVLGALFDGMPDRLLLLSMDPGGTSELVRIALDAGAPDRARAVVDAAEILARRNPTVPSLAGAAAHARGLLEGDLHALRAATEHYRRSPRPLARASALEDTAKAEQRGGDRSRAVVLLEAALDECRACDARRAVRRLEKRLRQFGVTRRPGATGITRASVLDGLTAAEREVALLVVDGLTNHQIAKRLQRSPHTVDSHLRKIFTKSGVNSRNALIKRVLDQDGSANIP